MLKWFQTVSTIHNFDSGTEEKDSKIVNFFLNFDFFLFYRKIFFILLTLLRSAAHANSPQTRVASLIFTFYQKMLNRFTKKIQIYKQYDEYLTKFYQNSTNSHL